MSSIMRRRNGLFASSVMGMLLSLGEGSEPLISRQDAPLRYPLGRVASRSVLPRERFSPVALFGHGAMSDLGPLCAQERTSKALVGRTPPSKLSSVTIDLYNEKIARDHFKNPRTREAGMKLSIALSALL